TVSVMQVPTPIRGAIVEVAGFADQVTGVAVSRDGRVFVNFPRWTAQPRYSVAELLSDGTLKPFPDAAWNRWNASSDNPAAHFICVQSVYADDADNLWILDPASPGFAGVVTGGAKLLKVNLTTGLVDRIYSFPPDVAPVKSYLNDVRVDTQRGFAYITDSGMGAIVVLDLGSGKARRVLANDATTKAEAGMVPVIEGKELRGTGGQPPQIHADGIALDKQGKYLYYHALTARTLYRVDAGFLRDVELSEKVLAEHVEKVAETGPADGMEMDGQGNLYLTSLEDNAVKVVRPGGALATVAIAPVIPWPDSLSIGPGDYLYFTASQINRMPRFNDGTDRRVPPYKLFRTWLAPQ
ncbi:MAG TPA: L-dopachrome tautomerase-related protein, partial [Geobacteraceae bacterium]